MLSNFFWSQSFQYTFYLLFFHLDSLQFYYYFYKSYFFNLSLTLLQLYIQIVLCQLLHYLFYYLIMSLLFLYSYHDIVNETCYFSSVYQVSQDLIYHHLKCYWRISQSKEYYYQFKQLFQSHKHHLSLILLLYPCIIIAPM